MKPPPFRNHGSTRCVLSWGIILWLMSCGDKPLTAQPTELQRTVAPSFDSVPGWLALGVRDDPPRHPWSPTHPTAHLLGIDPGPWTDVRSHEPLLAVTPRGVVPATFTGIGTIPYGCDGLPIDMATFSTPTRTGEGPIWVLPSDRSTSGRALPLSEDAVAPATRHYSATPYLFALRKRGDHTVHLDVRRGGTPLGARDFDQPMRPGDPPPTLDLSNDTVVGVPYPSMVFRLDANQPDLLITRTPTFEGLLFQVLLLDEDLTEVGGTYLYWCGF